MAIPMPIVQDIRRLDRQGMSRAQIARRLHVDRGTVAKYADMEDCSPKPKADRRYGSKIDPYAHLVDGWLEADRLLPRKQRHTIRRVHDRLLAETDYDGEYSTTMFLFNRKLRFGGGAVFLDCDPRRRRPWRSTRGNSGNARSSCM